MHLGSMLVALTCVLASTSAFAGSDEVEANVSWKLEIDAHTLNPGVSFSAGLRSSEFFAPLSQILMLSIDSHTSLAMLGGVPIAARSYRANQTEAVEGTSYGAKPWYMHSWVLWTAGGIATAAALGSGSSHGDGERSCSGTCNQQCADNTVSNCTGEICTGDICGPTGVGTGYEASRRAYRIEEREATEDSLDVHGGMGDLMESGHER